MTHRRSCICRSVSQSSCRHRLYKEYPGGDPLRKREHSKHLSAPLFGNKTGIVAQLPHNVGIAKFLGLIRKLVTRLEGYVQHIIQLT